MLKRPGIAYRRLRPTGPALETVIAWRRDSELPFVQAFVRVAGERARSRAFLSFLLPRPFLGGGGRENPRPSSRARGLQLSSPSTPPGERGTQSPPLHP